MWYAMDIHNERAWHKHNVRYGRLAVQLGVLLSGGGGKKWLMDKRCTHGSTRLMQSKSYTLFATMLILLAIALVIAV